MWYAWSVVTILGNVHTIGFVFVDTENAQHLSMDISVSRRRYVCMGFHLDPLSGAFSQ